MHTPDEAIAELEFAHAHGLKVAMIPPGVARPIPALEREHPARFPAAAYFDNYGLDSFHDYDPVWRKFEELKFAVTSHGGVGLRFLPLGRRSPSNYMFNHIGGHAYQQGELCRSLVFGGVPARFPNLAFGFLECGAGWAVDLLHSLEEHWEKRNVEGLKNYDPARLDRARLFALLKEYGGPEYIATIGRAARCAPTMKASRVTIAMPIATNGRDAGCARSTTSRASSRISFSDARPTTPASIARSTRAPIRFKTALPADLQLRHRPLGCSRHQAVLLESHHLADKGIISDADYRDFVFTYPARLHLKANPEFFTGTAIAGAVAKL